MRALLVLVILTPSIAFSAPALQVLSCNVSGANVWKTNNRSLSELYVDSSGVRAIGVALSEHSERENGEYNTYARLYVRTEQAFGNNLFEVKVDSTQQKGRVVYRSDREFTAEIYLPSRLGRKDMQVDISCTRVDTDYVLAPIYRDALADPVYASHYISTTIPNFLSPAGDEHFFTVGVKSKAEYLAENFCVRGNPATAATQMFDLDSIWRRDVLTPSVILKPDTIKIVNEGDITWTQRAQRLVCVKSHKETVLNDDTKMEEEITVCDEYAKEELAPLQLAIRACK